MSSAGAAVSLAVCAGVVFLVTLGPGQVIVLYSLITLFGLFMISALPVLITNAVEETYPLPAEASTSLLYVAAIVVQVPLTPVAELILDSEGGRCGRALSPFHIFIYIIAVVVCLIPALFYQGKPRRREAELAAASRHHVSLPIT